MNLPGLNPIVRRELLDVLRTPRAVALQLALAAGCLGLVLLRWPTGDTADLTGARAQEVLRVFGYGLLAAVLLLVPAVPATSLVREKVKGTLALLLDSPLTRWSIYGGKLAGVMGFAVVLLACTLPAAAACHALGGSSARGGIAGLYGLLLLAALQVSTLALLVSSRAQTTDGALRTTYALVLAGAVLTLVPFALMRGTAGPTTEAAGWLRGLSPVPAVMEALGQGDVGSAGLGAGSLANSAQQAGLASWAAPRYLLLALLTSAACALATIARLDHRLLDRARPAGVMTQDRSAGARVLRRLLYLIDPQRRAGAIPWWMNPVLAKEFRSRRFGRSHWTLRLVAVCAVLSLGLSTIAATGALDWGIETIGGAMVLLQVALLVLFAPSLAAGLISSERESGSWQLLRMTPLSPGTVLRGKLLSVAWPLLLLLCATLPGYVVMMTVKPTLLAQVQRVVACLALTAVFSVLLSAAASTLFRSTAASTTAAYLLLLTICVGPLLVWLGRDAPFGYDFVRAALTIDPVAAALQASETPGFTDYDLLPLSWWVTGAACLTLLVFLRVRVGQLCRPE